MAPNAEENEQLQERVTKAADYFSGKLISMVEEPFAAASFDTDNKAIRKTFNEAADKLRKEIHTKKVCLELCKNGFNIKNYLETRAKSAIEIPEKGQKGASSGSTFSRNPEFYTQIKNWRDAKADLLNVEVRRILPQKTMLDIVETLPANKAELKFIKGMGGTRMQQFGKEILEMVIAYLRSKGLALPVDAEKEAAKASLSTQETSLEMFRSGKTIPEIAQQRGMAVSTIESHLAHFIGTGEISIEKMVDPEKVKAILEYLDTHKGGNLSDIRTGLKNQYSFGEIRMVFKYLETIR
jgi:hypothetical protein